MKRTPLKPGKPLQRKTPMKPGSKPLKSAGKPMKSIGARAKRMRQGKIAANAEERAWLDLIDGFGCIVCRLFHNVKTPAAVHHIIEGGRRKGHLWSIPLCDPGHHQGSPTPEKISRHPNKKAFERAYGTEYELLEKLKQILCGNF